MNPRLLGLCASVSALLAAPTAAFAHDDDEEEISFTVRPLQCSVTKMSMATMRPW